MRWGCTKKRLRDSGAELEPRLNMTGNRVDPRLCGHCEEADMSCSPCPHVWPLPPSLNSNCLTRCFSRPINMCFRSILVCINTLTTFISHQILQGLLFPNAFCRSLKEMHVCTLFPSRDCKSPSVHSHVFIFNRFDTSPSLLSRAGAIVHKRVKQRGVRDAVHIGLHKHKQHNFNVGYPDNI